MPDPKMPPVIAHRGASGDAPENTLAAIRLAAEHGARWIEIDVNISSDGVPVLFHDDGLHRCSNGKGLVIEHSLASLQSLDCGAWFSDQFIGEKIATLDECLAVAHECELGINLEIKPCSGWELPTADAIAELLNNKTALPPIVISSFSHLAMQRAANLLPSLPRSSLFLVAPPDWRALVKEVGSSAIHLHANSLLNAEAIEEFKQQGLCTYCYTVNTTKQAEDLFAIGVDGVFTNYPKTLLEELTTS